MKLKWNGKMDGAIGGGRSYAIVGDHEDRPTDMTNVVIYETFRNNQERDDPEDNRRGNDVHDEFKRLSPRGGMATIWEGEDMATIVRRLTPLECERLQGFPDKWTDIGEWTDTKGKTHKEADSPRYKALGNSIAIPQWHQLFQRMAPFLPEDATLGSMFDGIGGFPAAWEDIHGKGTARWASEIEEFCIAVTKIRFPEPNAEER